MAIDHCQTEERDSDDKTQDGMSLRPSWTSKLWRMGHGPQIPTAVGVED